MPLTPGSRLAQYEVLSSLGAGGMGEVFLVQDLKLQRRAALKLISEQLTRDEARRQRFLQEARLAASIDHPHIAAIHDIGEQDGRTFIAMEYVDGRSLREMLRDGPLPLRRALDLAIQAGDALAKVHQHGVIHRDLKPENLLVTNDGYLKIIDFGLAKLVDPVANPALTNAATMPDGQVRTADGVVLGTMGYMAPEQVRGGAVDARSDVFGFGAVLYEMVTGHAPFRRTSGADTIGAILNDTPPMPQLDDAALGTELQRILRKCLAKDPGVRYQGVRDLVVDLRALRESVGSSASRAHEVPGVPGVPGVPKVPGVLGAYGVPGVLGAYGVPGVLALMAIVALGAVGAGWVLTRPAPAPSNPPAASTPTRPALAVMAFDVVSGTPEIAWLGKGLPSLLVTGLAQTPDLEVIGSERLSEAARQMSTTIEKLESSRRGELAKRAGAHFVVNGTIVQAGADFRIDARVEDLDSGAIRLATSVRGTDPLALADDLAARVRTGLNVTAAPATIKRIADVSSASVDAHRAWTTGVEAMNNNRWSDARKMFEEAIRLDPNFGLAYRELSVVAGAQGQNAEARKLLGLAAQHIDRMSERDAIIVRALVAVDQGRMAEARQLWEGLLARYPDTEQAWIGLQFAVDEASRPEVLRRAIAALPYSPILHNIYGYELLHKGRFEESIAAFQRYVQLRPAEPNALDSLAEGYLVSGNIAKALETYDAAIKGGYSGSPMGKVWTLAVAGRYDEATALIDANRDRRPSYRSFVLSRLGRYREAYQELARAREIADRDGSTDTVLALDLVGAMYALELGNCDSVNERVRSLTRTAKVLSAATLLSPPNRNVILATGDLLAGACEAHRNRLPAAREHLAAMRDRGTSFVQFDRWAIAALDGEIALAGGDFARAGRSFSEGEPERKMFFSRSGVGVPISFVSNNLLLRDGRARAAVGLGKLDEAIAIYRELLTPGPKQKWTAMLDPLHVIALARVLDKAGQRDAARAEYTRFLELWKDADADRPELAEARAALGR